MVGIASKDAAECATGSGVEVLEVLGPDWVTNWKCVASAVSCVLVVGVSARDLVPSSHSVLL